MNAYPRRIFVFILTIVMILSMTCPCFADEADLSALFQQAANADSNDKDALSASLSDAFSADPVGFLNALAEEDMPLWAAVADLMADYHTTPDGNAPYTQTVLETFANMDTISPSGMNVLCTMLVSIHVDLRNMEEGFLDALFAARTDGAASTKATYIAVLAFLQSPSDFVRELAEEDQEIQDHFTFLMVFDWYDTSYEPEMRQAIEELLNTELPVGELAVVNAFNDQWAAVDAMRAETTAPTESEPTAETAVSATNPIEPDNTSGSGSNNLLFVVIAIIGICVLAIIFAVLKKQRN